MVLAPAPEAASIDSSPRSTVLVKDDVAAAQKETIGIRAAARSGAAAMNGGSDPGKTAEPSAPASTVADKTPDSTDERERPSAAVTGAGATFFQGPPFGAHTPLSPPRAMVGGAGMPPASPLFPRAPPMMGDAGGVPPPSPSLPYMYPAPYGVGLGSGSSNSLDEVAAWSDSRGHPNNGYAQSSPQIQGMAAAMSYGMAFSRAAAGARAYSFDDGSGGLLPPSAYDDPSAYSPYSTGGQASPLPGAAGALFGPPPASWGYGTGSPIPDMYGAAPSPLQPRPAPMGLYGGGGGGGASLLGPPPGALRSLGAGGGGGGAYGHYYPASSPGPPIQTTASNKGPEGANLFIFHIPNHFTNLDMYQLFCAYGNLLSVRIMVEKETGRSRGFGFVSYDSPEAAALAIKELNGFAVGNKRLKVQHKQIRPKDLHHDNEDDHGFGVPPMSGGGGAYAQFPVSSSTRPPSGAGAAAAAAATQQLWYDGRPPPEGSAAVAAAPVSDGSSAGEAGPELTPSGDTGAAASTKTGGDDAPPYGPAESGGLASMKSLQNALPDIAGNGSAPE